ncbi:Sec-independent protein translocase subunit TatA [Nocardioides sp. MJB4]|uniref:Sec-independent protein translocase protein TatA n=1 Tax=Nocardioides donggukensis TaxID=2774019 RepID=A0A927K847_9ACTN|nr:Sec-independent protein translocase subunit TatA [Nocardioides donggukensis]
MGGLGTPELLIIFAVIILLFGAAKLPELARGSGRALRIFKAETKGLDGGDESDDVESGTDRGTMSAEERELKARNAESERIAREHRDGTTS